MKKRLLSLALSALLALGCLTPLTVLAADPEPTYPTIDEEAYNALYVEEGLFLAADFFRLNEYWGEEPPSLPKAPYLRDSYLYAYDKNKDGEIAEGEGDTVDLTKEENRVIVGSTTSGGVTKETRTFTSAYKAAIKDYRDELFAVLGDFVFKSVTHEDEDGDTITTGISQSLPSAGINAWNDLDGLAQHETFTFKDGFIRMISHNSNAMLRPSLAASGVEYSGHITAEAVMAPASLTSDAAILFHVRDLGFPMTVTDTTTSFTAIGGYGDIKKETLTKPVTIPGGKDVPLTLVISQDRVLNYTPAPTEDDPEAKAYKDATLTVSAWANGTPIVTAKTLTDTSTSSGCNSMLGYSTSLETSFYALRYYDRSLTEAERAQNHLADLCKYFRLDITRIATLHTSDLAYLAGRMADFSFTDDREAVAAALEELVDYLLEDSLTGSGTAFLTFLDAVKNGDVDASTVRALPAAHQGAIYTAYAALLAGTPEADAAARQAAVDGAVESVLTTHYKDYHNKTPLLTAEDFFAGKALSEAAAHFYEVALANDLDMKPLEGVDAVILEYIYLDFADVVPTVPSLTAVLQKQLVDATAKYRELYYGEAVVGDLLSFYGFQLTTVGEVGIRAVYTVDAAVLADLEAHGFTVSLGALFTSKAEAPTVVKSGNAYAPATGDIKQEAVYKTGAGYSGNHFKVGDATAFAYEHMTEDAQESLRFVAYAVLERDGQAPSIHYFAAKGDKIKTDAVTPNTLAKTCRDTVGVVYPNVQKLLVRRGTTEASPSVYIGNENLTEFRPVKDSEHSAMIREFLGAIRAYTLAPSAMPQVSLSEAKGTRLLRFEAADTVSFKKADDGSLVFTYVKGQEEKATALLEAELARVQENLYATGTPTLPTAFLIFGEIKDSTK